MAPNEVVRWVGQPTMRALLDDSMILLLIGAVHLTMAVVGIGVVLTKAAKGQVAQPWFMIAFLTIFICSGTFLIAVVAWRIAAVTRTVYAVTDRRVLEVSDLVWRRIVSTPFQGLNDVKRRNRNDGSATMRYRTERRSRAPLHRELHGIADPEGAAIAIHHLLLLRAGHPLDPS